MNIKEKYGPWAIVTGATSGIGRAMATELAAAGLNLVLISRNEGNLDKVATELEKKYKIETLNIPLNLANENFINIMAEKTSKLDIGMLASIAGDTYFGHHLDLSIQNELELVKLNVIAPTILSSYYAKKFAARKRGAIILTGSMLGYLGTPYSTTYAGTKAYEIVRGEGLAYELKKHGIDVLIMNPGLTKTAMTSNHDFSSLPLIMHKPESVARGAVAVLGGRRRVTTYGIINKMFNIFIKRVFSRRFNTNLFGFLLKKVIAKSKSK